MSQRLGTKNTRLEFNKNHVLTVNICSCRHKHSRNLHQYIVNVIQRLHAQRGRNTVLNSGLWLGHLNVNRTRYETCGRHFDMTPCETFEPVFQDGLAFQCKCFLSYFEGFIGFCLAVIYTSCLCVFPHCFISLTSPSSVFPPLCISVCLLPSLVVSLSVCSSCFCGSSFLQFSLQFAGFSPPCCLFQFCFLPVISVYCLAVLHLGPLFVTTQQFTLISI